MMQCGIGRIQIRQLLFFERIKKKKRVSKVSIYAWKDNDFGTFDLIKSRDLSFSPTVYGSCTNRSHHYHHELPMHHPAYKNTNIIDSVYM